jgi:hypothetical protein
MRGLGDSCIEKAHYGKLYRYNFILFIFSNMERLVLRALGPGWLNEMEL